MAALRGPVGGQGPRPPRPRPSRPDRAEAAQERVAKAIDACIRATGMSICLTEWHQYWKPPVEADLWPVSGSEPRKAGLDLFAKSCSPEAWAVV